MTNTMSAEVVGLQKKLADLAGMLPVSRQRPAQAIFD
jgi:hypothetical protein